MRRKQFFFRVAGFVFAVAALTAIVIWRMPPQTSAQVTTFEDAVNAVAAAFDDEIPVYHEIVQKDADHEPLCVFHSEQTQRDYYFTEDGVLTRIRGKSIDEQLETEGLPALEEDVMDKTMGELAANCLGPNRIGEMEIYSKNFCIGYYIYEFFEVYEGVKTGARVAVKCMPDGRILSASITQGGCFEKQANGAIEPVYDIQITPEQACQTAVAAVQEQLQGTEYSMTDKAPVCTLEALKDEQFYTVELEATSPMLEEGGIDPVIFWVSVYVTDGTVREILHSV